MNIYRKFFPVIIKKLGLLFLICFGLMTIIGTGDDDDDAVPTANNAPVAQIDSPTANTVYSLRNSITFTGSASDTEDLVLKGDSMNWVSSIDGTLGTGTSFTRNNLSTGTHEITLTVVDSHGSADSTSISITVNPESNTIPTATITSPSSGTTYNHGNFVEFTGTGYDPEDNWLSGNSLVWYSNKDGQIGTGNTVTTNFLSGGTHTISLIATDSHSTSNTATITLIVINTVPIATISYPADGSTFMSGESIPFNGSGTDTEDGNITGNSLVWTASNYGVIGFGNSITIDFLPAGTSIIINLKAVDSGGLVDSDTITLTISP